MVTNGLETDLKTLIGSAGICTYDLAPYEQGYRYGRGQAALIARPNSTKQVSDILRYCFEKDISVLPQGAHTGLVGAATPDATGTQLLLSLNRLTGVTAFVPMDKTVTCKAGTLLSQLNEHVEPEGLFFPVDLGADPSIGGMVATNTGGAKLLRYGDVRQNLLGLEVVLADEDGTIWSQCEGLRKDNTGLDIKQLFVGTSGQFGIVTAATVNLHRRPKQSASALVVPKTLAVCPVILSALEDALGDMLTACEGVSGAALKAALEHHPALRNPFSDSGIPDMCLLLEAATSIAPGGPLEIETILADALWPLMEGLDPTVSDVRLTTGPDFWTVRHSISDGLKRSGQVIAFDIAVPRSKVPALIESLSSRCAEIAPGLNICHFGHLGDGGVHFNLVNPSANPANVDEDALRRHIYSIVVNDFNGSISAEHGIGPSNEVFYEAFVPDWRRDAQANIKRSFDQKGILGRR